MDHIGIVKRALRITWNYRMLWIFGVLITIFSGGDKGSSSIRGYSIDGKEINLPPGADLSAIPDVSVLAGAVAGIILVLMGLAVLIALLSVVIRYVSETAVIRAVDEHERTGEKRSFGYALKLGWSRGALRLFVIDLVVALPTATVFILLFLVALAPLLLWATGSDTAGIIGTVATIGFLVLVVMALILVAIILSLLKPFFWRACLLDGYGVFDSIRHGYRVVRHRLADAGVMWLILAGMEIAWGILLVPVVIVLGMLALLLGGVAGLMVGGLASLTFYGSTPYVLGAIAGAPIGIIVFAVPMVGLSALAVVFKSSTWTLTYRELTV